MCRNAMSKELNTQHKFGHVVLCFMIGCLCVGHAMASNVLFISDQEPHAQDQWMIDYLEEAGHVVTILADDDVADDGEALALANDVVIASESSSSSKVANLRKDIEVPLVCLEYYAWDDFGMVASGIQNAQATSNYLTIVSPDHYLAAGFSGSVRVFDDYSDCLISPATVGSEATVIARAEGVGDVIFVYEKGSTLADGSVAAEIRLGFGFGYPSYDNWTDNTFQLLGAVINQALDLDGPAIYPCPFDEDADLLPDEVQLSWTPSEGIESYTLYFGADFDDVNDGTVGIPLDVNAFDPAPIEFGQTYYWRVDGIAGSDTYRGKVWSFSTEALAFTFTDDIAATASSTKPGYSAGSTTDGSGLTDESELIDRVHSNSDADMWLSERDPAVPVWLEYDLGEATKLYEMWVWNYNGDLEQEVGYGVQDVTVQTSLDNQTWTTLGDTVFAQASGNADEPVNSIVSMESTVAQYVRLMINSSYGNDYGVARYGLSEVVYSYIPTRARKPEPDSGTIDVPVDVTLDWNPGRDAVTHDVYLSENEQDVIDNVAWLDTVNISEMSPTGLDLATTYYWKVNEVNNADPVMTVWSGPVWSFTTADYLIVEDFEEYDDQCNCIFWSWVDGYGFSDDNGCTNFTPSNGNGSGAFVGYSDPPYAEQETVRYNGEQSMPLFYENDDNDDESYASLRLSPAQDWTATDTPYLVLYFYGAEDNDAGQLYLLINGTKILHEGDTSDLTRTFWTQWVIDLDTVNGVDWSQIETVGIGVEGEGEGVVFVDDIRLYREVPVRAQAEEWFEAEKADSITAPLAVYDDDPSASNGQYLMGVDDSFGNEPDDLNRGYATYTVELPAGTYRMTALASNGASFWVRLNGATLNVDGFEPRPNYPNYNWIHWDLEDTDDWMEMPITSADDDDAIVEFTVEGGFYKLEIDMRHEEAKLDAFIFTQQ